MTVGGPRPELGGVLPVLGSRGSDAESSDLSIVARLVGAQRSRRGGSPAAGDASGGGGEGALLLSDAQLSEIEASHAEGIGAVEVVDIFRSRGVRFSEATFRKYVQQGLLPRSRRIGRKGKHRGSMGVYPAKTVRRINSIKRLMADGYTIEEIEAQFLRYTEIVESLEEGVVDLFERLDADAESPRFDSKVKKSLKKEIEEARRTADDLLKRIGGISERVSASHRDTNRGSGAAGSAEDLL